MLYALSRPVSLLGLVVAFLLGIVVLGVVQALAAGRAGDRQARAEGRTGPDPRRHLDPFGAIAAALAGTGWGRAVPLEPRRLRGGRATAALVLLSGPLTVLLLAALALVGFVAVGGDRSLLGVVAPADVLHGISGLPAEQVLLLSLAMGLLFLGLLALVPLPPLPGWRLLELFVRPTPGWQRARYQLAENNWGVGILLALLLLPLGGGNLPLLVSLLDAIARPLVHLVGR